MIPVGTALAANEPSHTIRSLPSGVLPVSDYYNQSIYDAKDNKIGDISDLLLDTEGKVSAVILGVGGFLGAGEKNVAVPFNAIKLTEKNGYDQRGAKQRAGLHVRPDQEGVDPR